MSDHVWLSIAMTKAGSAPSVNTDTSGTDVNKTVKAITLNEKGERVSEDLCANRIWTVEDTPFIENMPDFFSAQGYRIVSSHVADILRRFNLGGGALYPVKEGVYQADNKTRIGGDYFSWIFGNTKTAFLEQFSPNVEAMSGSGKRNWCSIASSNIDNDVAVSSNALSGPDVWVDPQLFKSIFLSGPLGDALVEGGFKKSLFLIRCRVIS